MSDSSIFIFISSPTEPVSPLPISMPLAQIKALNDQDVTPTPTPPVKTPEPTSTSVAPPTPAPLAVPANQIDILPALPPSPHYSDLSQLSSLSSGAFSTDEDDVQIELGTNSVSTNFVMLRTGASHPSLAQEDAKGSIDADLGPSLPEFATIKALASRTDELSLLPTRASSATEGSPIYETHLPNSLNESTAPLRSPPLMRPPTRVREPSTEEMKEAFNKTKNVNVTAYSPGRDTDGVHTSQPPVQTKPAAPPSVDSSHPDNTSKSAKSTKTSLAAAVAAPVFTPHCHSPIENSMLPSWNPMLSAVPNKKSSDTSSSAPVPNVYINGLPPYLPEEKLYALCSNFGAIKSVRCFTRHIGEKETGYGFVLFDSIEAGERCIEALRRYRNLHPSWSKQIHKIPGTIYHSGSEEEIYDIGGMAGDRAAEESFKTRMERLHDIASTNLYMEGLPLTIDEQSLAGLVAPYAIKSSRFFQTKLSDPPKMIAFVRMETRTAAEEIIERLHGRIVRGWGDEGARISVRFADTAEQRELRRNERVSREGSVNTGDSPNRLTIAQAALLNLRGKEHILDLRAQRDPKPARSPSIQTSSSLQYIPGDLDSKHGRRHIASLPPPDADGNLDVNALQVPADIHKQPQALHLPSTGLNVTRSAPGDMSGMRAMADIGLTPAEEYLIRARFAERNFGMQADFAHDHHSIDNYGQDIRQLYELSRQARAPLADISTRPSAVNATFQDRANQPAARRGGAPHGKHAPLERNMNQNISMGAIDPYTIAMHRNLNLLQEQNLRSLIVNGQYQQNHIHSSYSQANGIGMSRQLGTAQTLPPFDKTDISPTLNVRDNALLQRLHQRTSLATFSSLRQAETDGLQAPYSEMETSPELTYGSRTPASLSPSTPYLAGSNKTTSHDQETSPELQVNAGFARKANNGGSKDLKIRGQTSEESSHHHNPRAVRFVDHSTLASGKSSKKWANSKAPHAQLRRAA